MKLRLEQITSYLKEPYPYYYRDRKRFLLWLLLISMVSFCFSYFFEPFEVTIAEHKINSIGILLIHAFIPFPIAYVYIHIINKKLKNDMDWTLGKEIFNLSMILLIIGIVDFLIRDLIYTNPDNWSLRYFWEEIRNTFLVGFLLLVVVLPINLERLINKHTSHLKKLRFNTVPKEKDDTITIKNLVSNEDFELRIKDFLFAKVESNYTEIVTLSEDGIHKTLIRIPLKELEEQLRAVPSVLKIHRSYLVHLDAIESVSGNAQGYQLKLKNCPTQIPVSRSNIAHFNTIYSKT